MSQPARGSLPAATLDEFFHDTAAVRGGQINDSLVSFNFKDKAIGGRDSP